MNPPATRVIALSNLEISEGPDELSDFDPNLLVEVVLVGIMPDGEKINAFVSMTAEDEQNIINWTTTIPLKSFQELMTMRSIINPPKDISGIENEMNQNGLPCQYTKTNSSNKALSVSGKALAKFWKIQAFVSSEKTRLTIKYLRKVADVLPDIWKKDALQLAEKLENALFKSPKLKRDTASFCSFSAELIDSF